MKREWAYTWRNKSVVKNVHIYFRNLCNDSQIETILSYNCSNCINPTNAHQDNNNCANSGRTTNTHVHDNEGFDASQPEVIGTGDSATYVTHPAHLQYNNLPPQQHVYENVS